jgi:hypothetical protein
MDQNKPSEFVMVVDPLPSSNLNINKYLKRHDFSILEDLARENIAKVTCGHSVTCTLFNELVMMKEFVRDDRLYFDRELRKTEPQPIFVENGHITNLLYCKLSDVKLYKEYMKEFKKRRRNWEYRAIVVRNSKMATSALEKKMTSELLRVLQQAQIKYTIINKFKNVTFLRKSIFRHIQNIINPEMVMSTEDESELDLDI